MIRPDAVAVLSWTIGSGMGKSLNLAAWLDLCNRGGNPVRGLLMVVVGL